MGFFVKKKISEFSPILKGLRFTVEIESKKGYYSETMTLGLSQGKGKR
jgi:hypothetical protein